VTYNASEKTLCAFYLSRYILAGRYRRVVWIVPDKVPVGSRYHGFSFKWDKEVIPIQSKPDELKIRLNEQDIKTGRSNPCEICIFFEESEELYSLLPPTTKTLFVLDHHKWSHETSRNFAKKCTYSLIVSPYLVKKIIQPSCIQNEFLCPFDPAIQMAPKRFLSVGEKSTIFFPAFGMTFSERQCLMQISEIVKTCCPDSQSVISYYDANDKPAAGKDARTDAWRIMSYLKEADWIVDLNPRPLMGLFTAFAGASGIQWSAFDIPPNTDEYSAARRHLIPFPKGGLILANAEEIASHIVRQLTTVFMDDAARNRHAGSYFKRVHEFYRAMNKLFGTAKSKKKKK
jgi:hypothetical protein